MYWSTLGCSYRRWLRMVCTAWKYGSSGDVSLPICHRMRGTVYICACVCVCVRVCVRARVCARACV